MYTIFLFLFFISVPKHWKVPINTSFNIHNDYSNFSSYKYCGKDKRGYVTFGELISQDRL